MRDTSSPRGELFRYNFFVNCFSGETWERRKPRGSRVCHIYTLACFLGDTPSLCSVSSSPVSDSASLHSQALASPLPPLPVFPSNCPFCRLGSTGTLHPSPTPAPPPPPSMFSCSCWGLLVPWWSFIPAWKCTLQLSCISLVRFVGPWQMGDAQACWSWGENLPPEHQTYSVWLHLI